MAGFSLLVWDHICTFQEEVNLMWPAPRSLVKILFMGVRFDFIAFEQSLTVGSSGHFPESLESIHHSFFPSHNRRSYVLLLKPNCRHSETEVYMQS